MHINRIQPFSAYSSIQRNNNQHQRQIAFKGVGCDGIEDDFLNRSELIRQNQIDCESHCVEGDTFWDIIRGVPKPKYPIDISLVEDLDEPPRPKRKKETADDLADEAGI